MTGNQKTILFVDDEPQYTHSMVEELEDSGYDVIQVTEDGSEALSVVENNSSIDLIVLDIMMPTGNRIQNATGGRRTGLKVASYIRTTLRLLIPIVFFTVIEDQAVHHEIERMEREAGLKEAHIMVKPVAPLELLERVRSLIGTAD